MAEANFVVNVSAKLISGLNPFNAVGKALDAVTTTTRRTMRSFRDMVIVFYGVRRGFDLLSRTIKSTFEQAGGPGTRQIETLSDAVSAWSGDVGKAIQKSQTFQKTIKSLTDAFSQGISKDDQERIAQAIDDIAAGIIDTSATIIEKLGQVFDWIDDKIGGIQRRWEQFYAVGKGIADWIKEVSGRDDAPSKVAARQQADNLDTSWLPKSLGPQQKMPNLGGIEDYQKNLRESMKDMPPSSLPELMKKTAGELRAGRGKGSDSPVGDLTDQLQAAIKKIKEMGDVWVSTMSEFGAEAMDKSIGINKAFSNLGKNAKKAFLNQMSTEAFSPMKNAFSALANAAAAPFRIIGNVINNVVVEPITKFISTAIVSLFSSIIGQQVAAKAAGDGLAAASVATNAVTANALLSLYGPAAVAAAIASFGGANAAGGIAMGQIQAARIPFAAEGMVVMPRSGGTLVGVGEAGEPETILPLSKAKEMGFGGGGGLTIVVNGDLKSTSSNRRLARNLAKEVHREMTSGRYAGGSRRRV